jgi:hypothetical protein
MMCPAIDNPASCEIRAVIRILHYNNLSTSENHRELRKVYIKKCNEWRNSKTVV